MDPLRSKHRFGAQCRDSDTLVYAAEALSGLREGGQLDPEPLLPEEFDDWQQTDVGRRDDHRIDAARQRRRIHRDLHEPLTPILEADQGVETSTAQRLAPTALLAPEVSDAAGHVATATNLLEQADRAQVSVEFGRGSLLEALEVGQNREPLRC